jgi:hypothetical protein
MTLKRTTIAALIAAAIGTTALATATFADNGTGPANGNGNGYNFQLQGQNMHPGNMGPGRGMGERFDWGRGNGPMRPGMMMGKLGAGPAGGLLTLACSPKGAEALDIAFVRLSYRLGLTADQQKLFDTLRTDALTAQTKFADDCKAEMPGKTAANNQAPDFLERMKGRLSLEQSRLDAMTKLMPDVEALYASLTPAQKAKLEPAMPGRGERPPMMGRMQRPVDLPETPAAPAAPNADAPVLNG